MSKPEQRPPTRQGLGAQGPGNVHGLSGDGIQDGEPLDPPAAPPAADPQAMAQRVLDQANRGPAAEGDAGPRAAQGARK